MIRKLQNDTLLTGVFYLALAICGGISFLWIRGEILVEADAAATRSHLIDREALARVGLVLELGLVLFQSLCSIWFWKTFRMLDGVASVFLMIFGLMNAVVIIGSTASLATALNLGLEPGTGNLEFSYLMYELSEQFWQVGNLFFGLWLIPMGLLARAANWGNPVLWLALTLGGVLYALGPFVIFASSDAGWIANILVIPGTIGEIWMIGLLFLNGWRGITPG